MLNTLHATYTFCKLQERLVKKNTENTTTILIVDDDLDTLTVTGRNLEHAGFKVHALQIRLKHYIMFRMVANTAKSWCLMLGCLH